MPLESHSNEARDLLAAFLASLLFKPGYWYGPMFGEDHQASLCQLAGLSSEERDCLLVASLCAKKWGKTQSIRFYANDFAKFVDSYPHIGKLPKSHVQLKGMAKQHFVYFIGADTGDARVATFRDQVESKVPPPTIDATNPHRIALKAFVEKLVREHNKEADGNRSNDFSTGASGAGVPAPVTDDRRARPSSSLEGAATAMTSSDQDKGSASVYSTPMYVEQRQSHSQLLSTKRTLAYSSDDVDQSRRPSKKKPPPTSWMRATLAESTTLRQCQGIPHPKLKNGISGMHPQTLLDLMGRFNYVEDHFCHKDCCGLFQPSSPTDESCANCHSAAHTIRADRIPGLFSRPSSVADIAQSEQMVKSTIENAAAKFDSIDLFEASPEAQKFALHLRVYDRESIIFNHHSRPYALAISHCSDCHCCIIRRAASSKKRSIEESETTSSITLCDSCKQDARNERRRVDNYKEVHGDPSSHTTLKSLMLSPKRRRLTKRHAGLARKVKTQAQRIRRLEQTIQNITSENNLMKTKLPEVDSNGNPGAIRGILTRLMDAIKQESGDGDSAKTKQKVRDELVLCILNDALSDDDKHSPYTMEEARRFATGIRQEIEKYALKVMGKEKQIRFSPQVFQVAMKIWMRSPAAYEDMRKSGWIVSLPSQTTLRRLRKETKVEEGESVVLYARVAENRLHDGQVLYGYVSCDEMKLIEGVAWSTHGHRCIGFAGDFESLDTSVRGILSGKLEKEPAVEVNQWKYRALNEDLSFECEFFYNGGNLSNADIRRQKLQVITGLELINCLVFGFSADGASKNVTAMRLNSEAGTSVVPRSQAWLDVKYLSVSHPLDPIRRLWTWLCSTHQQKSMRTQWWTSREKGKRSFVSADGYNIRWEVLWDQFNRDQARRAPQARLKLDALLLDGWARMNVALAKAPFQDAALSEALQHICTQASIPIPVGDENEYETHPACLCPSLAASFGRPKYRRLLGMFSARLAKAKAAVLAKKEDLDGKFQSIMDEIATLEYRAVIHEIFIEILMNKDLHFCRANVAELKTYLKQKMEYFAKWHDAMRQRKAIHEDADLTFLSMQTWANVRFTVCGFVEFAAYILQTASETEVEYVPMLMSNTSNLEALFSHMKSLGGRDAQTYMTRIGSRSTEGSIDAQRRSSSYGTNENLPESEIDDGRDDPRLMRELNSDMAKRKATWLSRFDGRENQTIRLVPDGHPGINSKSAVAVAACMYLKEKKLTCHFTEAIARNGFLADFFLLSKYSGREHLFDTLSNLDASQEEQFNKACQSVVVHFLAVVKKMVEVAEEYTLKLEQAALKELEAETLEAEKRKEQAAKGIESIEKGKKRKKKTIKPPEGVFESACFQFIQGKTMERFMAKLPEQLGEDRLFSVVLLQCLLRLIRQWTSEALKAVPSAVMPKIPGLKSLPGNSNFRALVSVDEDSEIHRFVASAITAYRKVAKKRIKRLKTLRDDRIKESKRPKRQHERNIDKMEEAKRLLDEMGIRKKNLPKEHDKSYDSEVLRALSRGGLLYVAPKYLWWAKVLMKSIRASISFDVISANGSEAQDKAYKFLLEDGVLLKKFKQSMKETEIGESAVEWVFKRIVGYAFHARSQVEWKKYRAEKTDRSKGKSKKMGTREYLKAGSKLKEESK